MGGGSSEQTTGYKYSLGQHLIFCKAPVDAVYEILVDGKTLWSGEVTSNTRLNFNKGKLFGGQKKEGGVKGPADVEFGEPDQGKNDYLVRKLGEDIPGHRGVLGLVLRRVYIGTVPVLKPWSLKATRILRRMDGTAQWYQEKASISYDNDEDTVLFSSNFEPTLAVVTNPPNYEHPNTLNVGNIGGKNIRIVSTSFVSIDTRLVINGSLVPGVAGFPAGAPAGTLLWSGYVEGDLTITVWDKDQEDENLGHGTGGVGAEGTFDVLYSPYIDKDINPVHAIRECLTDREFGLGHSDEDIDDDSFKAAADVIYTEKLGISVLYENSASIRKFISMLLKHIDAVIYVSRSTGKWTIKLIRNDYDVGTLLSFDESNIESVSNPSKKVLDELTNKVTVNFFDSTIGKNSSIPVDDPAMYQEMGGQILEAEVNYPAFSNVRNAVIAGKRDLRSLSFPFFGCTIYANRDALNLNIGDVIKFSWDRWNISNKVMRITNIAFGSGKTTKVKLTVTEDIFSTDLSVNVSQEASAWVNPINEPQPAVNQISGEIPYYELVTSLGQSEVDGNLSINPQLGYVFVGAAENTYSTGCSIWTDVGLGYEDVGNLAFCPYMELVNNISPEQTEILYTAEQDIDEIVIGTFFQIGTTESTMEIIRIDAIDEITGTITVGRGCLDTTPRQHNAGDGCFFWDRFNGYDQTEYTSGESINAVVTPINSAGEVGTEEATAMTVVMNQRANRPYPPGQFQINSTYYPTDEITGTITVTWADRDRTQQTSGVIYDHTTGNIGPEVGTTYVMRCYIDGVLDLEIDPATSGETWTPSSEGVAKIEVYSERDSLLSIQPAEHTFIYGGSEARGLEGENETWLEFEDGSVHVTED